MRADFGKAAVSTIALVLAMSAWTGLMPGQSEAQSVDPPPTTVPGDSAPPAEDPSVPLDDADDSDGASPDAAPSATPESRPPPLEDSLVAGAEVTLHLKSGQRATGIFVSMDDEYYTVSIARIQSRFERSTVLRVDILPPVLDRYAELKAGCGNDAAQLLSLVAWLEARDLLDLALVECENVRRIDPFNAEALRKQQILSELISLRKKSRTGTPVKGEPQGDGEREDAAKRADPFPLLTPEQINILKVYEIDLEDPPGLVIKRDTIDRLVERYADHEGMPPTKEGRDALYRVTEIQLLRLMFKIRARDLYGEVQVLRGENPGSMKKFRDDVNAMWLVNACSTNDCHGGTEAGNFRLFNRRPTSDQSFYTNFLILDRYRTKGGKGDALINFDDPAKSPILQIGLPRRLSRWPHPEVPRGISGHDAFRPVFSGEEDRKFQRAVAWIKSMYRPHPDYPVDYTPPEAEPAGEETSPVPIAPAPVKEDEPPPPVDVPR